MWQLSKIHQPPFFTTRRNNNIKSLCNIYVTSYFLLIYINLIVKLDEFKLISG